MQGAIPTSQSHNPYRLATPAESTSPTDIEASEISRFRELLHVSNVLAFREKMKKVTISSKCTKNLWIYRADKQANIHCRAFTALDNYTCL